MQLLRSYPAGKWKLDWWYGIAVAIAVSQCALALVLKQGFFLTAYTNIGYFLLILVPGGIAAGNAVRSSHAIRLFWLFLAVGFALWALSAGFWVEAILRGRASPVPDISLSNPPLFLHVVFFMAAAVTRPHLSWPSRKLYQTTANSLLLLFFWFFIYTFLQFPYHHTSREFSRYSALYFTENIALLAVLGWLIARVHGPWRRVYAHFFCASALYATGSLVNNMATSRSGYKGGLYDVPLFAALCWLVWVTLLGRKTVHELEESRQPTIFNLRYISLLATLAVVAIPATGLWELYRANEPYETRVIRLLIVLLSVSFLAVCAFVKGYLANRELSSEVSLADERFRLAIHAGKMYAYEWDVATDVVIRSKEYVNILGFTEQTGKSTRQEVLARVHPDDRVLFADSIDRLIPENPTTQISYRIVRPDGSVVWLEKNARAFFNQQGRMLRVVGMVTDITEHKRAEEALASVSRRLIESQEQERARIGRELHDDIGQRLALLAIELQQLHEDSLILPDVRNRMGKLQKQTSEIAADIQSLSHELHTAKLQYLGVVGAVRGFCREFGERQKVEIDFRSRDLPTPLSSEISLCLYRVLQEALHNGAKHSGVGHFEVQLWGAPGEIHLTVKDLGGGFDTEAAMKGRGLGLTSMRERLGLVNGQLSIDSQPQRGTTIHARIPFSLGSDSARAAQ